MKKLFLYIFSFRSQNSILNQFIRTIIVMLEMYKIFFMKKILKYKEVIIVYDCKVSPATYGDFMEILLLARAIKNYNLKIKIILIIGEYRLSWHERFNDISRKKHIKYMNYMSKEILSEKKNIFSELNWKEFNKNFLNRKKNKSFILFKRKVFRRRPIYSHAINLTNHILNKNINLQNKTLLKSKDINANIKNFFFTRNYICIGGRHETNKPERNLTKVLFLKLINKLNKIYPDYEKVLISNVLGCNYFKKISRKYSLNCKFSKDYTYDFLGDGKIILNSKAYFEIRGGGVSVFALFSRIPFVKVNSSSPVEHHYICWSKSKSQVYSWQNNKQIFILKPKSFNKKINDELFFKKLNYFRANTKLN